MKPFRWNDDKNEQRKSTRGIGFEEIVVAIAGDGLLDLVAHPNLKKYPWRQILVVACRDYAWLIPFVEEAEYYFLKTIIPSRKATRDFLFKKSSEDTKHGSTES